MHGRNNKKWKQLEKKDEWMKKRRKKQERKWIEWWMNEWFGWRRKGRANGEHPMNETTKRKKENLNLALWYKINVINLVCRLSCCFRTRYPRNDDWIFTADLGNINHTKSKKLNWKLSCKKKKKKKEEKNTLFFYITK